MTESNPAVVFTNPRQVAVLPDFWQKESPKDGELLIRTRRSLISTGTELTYLTADFPAGSVWDAETSFPMVPGYSNVGEVVAVGPGTDESWIGKQVASESPHSLYAVAQADQVHAIPREEVSDEVATFFTISEIVMNGVRRGGAGWGEAIVVFGLGLLGQLTVRYCRMCGARPVFAVDVADSRLGLLPKDAGIVPVNARRDDVVEVVKKATRGRMADAVFEVTGDQNLIPGGFRPLRQQGRFVVLSSPRGVTPFDFCDLCNDPSFTIIGTHNNSHPRHGELDLPWTRRRHAELFFDLVSDGELLIEPLISHRAPYTDAPRLYQMLLEDRSRAMGVVLEWPE
jgi:threonine dehydrogenase-like Zn-dependent dehydrogenase